MFKNRQTIFFCHGPHEVFGFLTTAPNAERSVQFFALALDFSVYVVQ
jgi:hypothetical protein